MKRLHIIIKSVYLNQIISAEKIFEYRLITPYWIKKLVGKNYDYIEFQAGYSSKSKRIKIEYLGYEITTIKHDFFGNDEVSVFKIKLGKII